MPLTATEAFQLLENAHRQDRLSHAYLITGPEGAGKRALAAQLCDLLVPGGMKDPLQRPDVHTVQPESKSRRIVIEQMREMESQLRMHSSAGGKKVGIVFHADRLQPQASNAFLKTLEEPPAKTHLLLVTAFPDQLLETILSRCIEISLRTTSKPPLTPRQEELLQTLKKAAARGGLDLPQTFGLVREFQRILAAAKEEAQAAGEAELKSEEQRYKQIADAKWFEEREDYFKALGEARYIGERSQLLEVLEQWWADVLRQQSGIGEVEYPALAETTAALAGTLSTGEALRRAGALERLRENLANPGIQEPLALEVAFLAAFGA
jgi:DNA polymerase-3 subunit delta'